ncbi:MAG: metallophosphoesterase [Nitrospinota bacterium]|nr:MAG: metallophosphoesterase [Nitrospinota bacterium]
MGAEWFNPVARAAVEWCTRVLKPEHIRWLQQLPYQIREEDMLFCHGSPYRQEEFPYLFSPAQAREVFLHVPDLPPLTFVGHTHRPITFFSPLTSRTEIDVITDDTFTVTPQNRYIINVGSVGQPRDGDWRACYALFDSESRECRMVRVEYDVEQAYEKIRQAGLPRQLGERLFYGM